MFWRLIKLLRHDSNGYSQEKYREREKKCFLSRLVFFLSPSSSLSLLQSPVLALRFTLQTKKNLIWMLEISGRNKTKKGKDRKREREGEREGERERGR